MRLLIQSKTRSNLISLGRRCYSCDRNDGLRILFCGADTFSIASLKALHSESKQFDSNILSLDVVTKKDKRSGRGLKHLKPPPIKPITLELGLPLHQIDTFTGWSPPKYGFENINLVVAVSFGLLIPPRILNGSKYGGLNVHPSLLPDLRGAAPIQWSLILGRKETGVSIQTLHPTKFDEGIVLDQTEPLQMLGTDIRSETDRLGKIGAEMLVKAIRERSYIPPYQGATTTSRPSLAPRIKPVDKLIDFGNMSLEHILNRNRAIPKLFVMAEQQDGTKVRVLLEPDLRKSTNDIPSDVIGECKQMPVGHAYAIRNLDSLFVNTISEEYLVIPKITVAGDHPRPAVQAASRAHLLANLKPESHIRPFHKPFSIELTG